MILLVWLLTFCLKWTPISMIQIDFTNQTDECLKWTKTHLFEDTQLHLENNTASSRLLHIEFDNFAQLNEDIPPKCEKSFVNYAEKISLNARQKILIEDILDLYRLLALVDSDLFTNNQISTLVIR